MIMKSFEEYLAESYNDQGIFKAVFMLGSPASGKSFMQQELTGGIYPRIVNSDKFTRTYYGKEKEAYDIILGDISDELINKSVSLQRNQLAMYIQGHLPLLIDSTSSNDITLKNRIKILKDNGYDIAMVYIHTPLDVAIRRNNERKASGNGGVPEDFLRDTYAKIEANYEHYKTLFSEVYLIDNSSDNAFAIDFNTIYKKVRNFYISPVKNPIGQEYIRNKTEIKEVNLNGWYAE